MDTPSTKDITPNEKQSIPGANMAVEDKNKPMPIVSTIAPIKVKVLLLRLNFELICTNSISKSYPKRSNTAIGC
ncbi:protein of unknown function [Shewanella benthica]|uniref:Uncharacterized protein n=1 Tax=Shewanella benthica TaxID=43661 RepID=A0A330M3X8_9GAMM|nr:protein of unknown function [Shewanella benthica]